MVVASYIHQWLVFHAPLGFPPSPCDLVVLGTEVETGVEPSLVPYDFVNVGIEVEAFHREGVEILEVVGEGRVTEEDPNCLCQPAVYLLDLKLNQTKNVSSND